VIRIKTVTKTVMKRSKHDGVESVKAAAKYRISFDELAWEACGSGVRHKVHRRGEQLLRLVEYSAKMPPHWCNRGHVGTILRAGSRLSLLFRRAPSFGAWLRDHHLPAPTRSNSMQPDIVKFEETRVAALDHRGPPETAPVKGFVPSVRAISPPLER
jgi:hypothetical protein